MATAQDITLDPTDPFEAVVMEMVRLNRKKRSDYAGDGHIFQNFYDSAYQLGLTPGHSVETLVATKQARLRVLGVEDKRIVENETKRDTILDRAVYSAIAVALYDEGSYAQTWQD